MVAGELQAKIDALMLEYCPDEMTTEQIENWKRHQKAATLGTEAALQRALLSEPPPQPASGKVASQPASGAVELLSEIRDMFAAKLDVPYPQYTPATQTFLTVSIRQLRQRMDAALRAAPSASVEFYANPQQDVTYGEKEPLHGKDAFQLSDGAQSHAGTPQPSGEAGKTPFAREYEGPQWQFWQEGDRFYHEKDNTWWRFDVEAGRLVRAKPSSEVLKEIRRLRAGPVLTVGRYEHGWDHALARVEAALLAAPASGKITK